MSKRLSLKRAMPPIMLATGSLFLSGCALPGNKSPEVISICTPDEASGTQAVVGAADPSLDPNKILDFAIKEGLDDPTGGRQGFNNAAGDRINGLGELVCENIMQNDSMLVFLPGAEQIRANYIQQLG